MKDKIISICIIFLFLFLITGCNETSEETPTPASPTENLSAEPVNLEPAYTAFSLNLYSTILKENKEKNLFISPSSIALALAMTYNGAEGETKEAMAKVLEVNNLSMDDLNYGSKFLINHLNTSEPKVKIAVANSLWSGPEIEFKPDFIKRCEDYYFARVENVITEEAINGWVKKSTEGKIEKIIEKVPPDAVLYLINAIYFKGAWQQEFDKNGTKEMDFHLLDGTSKKHPLMMQSGKYNYLKGENFQAVSIPYGEGNYSMYIFLPDKNSGLEEFQENLSTQNWKKWMAGFREKEGDIFIPKFTIEYSALLNDTLKSMGMEIAFSGSADFSNMCSESVFISRVIHKTFIEVNEEGTEAAGVTAVEMSKGINPEKFKMKVDRPFFFCIKDNVKGIILFMGSVVDPAE